MNRLVQHFFHAPTAVFTQTEVAGALDGSKYSRQGLIKRAIAAGDIIHLRRGLYCLAPRYQKRRISVFSMAQRLYGPSYISLESALSFHGWIPEAVYGCTSVSFGNAKEYDTPLGLFSFQRVPQETFYTGVERQLDPNGTAFLVASPVKALTDVVYVQGHNWQGPKEAAASMRIDVDDLASVSADQLQLIFSNCTSQRVKSFLKSWLRELAT